MNASSSNPSSPGSEANPANSADSEARVAHCYSTWGESYYQDYYANPGVYPPVHLDIARAEIRQHGARNLLDAGCGPASMLRHFEWLGNERYGFDLTPEMLSEARRILALQGVPAAHLWQGSVSDQAAFVPPLLDAPQAFDAVLCFGVLPHIPSEADERVARNIRQRLNPGGVALVEARNQLFALFTANRPSYEFILHELVRAPELLTSNPEEAPTIEKALDEWKASFRMELPPRRHGKAGEPGYDEVLSRTHNPLLLKEIYEKAGFSKVELLFFHFHCLPPMMEPRFKDFYQRASLRMENPKDWRGLFMASGFIIKAVVPDVDNL